MHGHGGEEVRGNVLACLNGMFLPVLLLRLFSLRAVTLPIDAPCTSYFKLVAAAFLTAVGGLLVLGGSPNVRDSTGIRLEPIFWLACCVVK